MSCVCDDFFHNESEQFTFTCSARHGKKKLQFPSRKWSFDLIMRNRRKLSNHFLVKPYLSFSNFSFLHHFCEFGYLFTNEQTQFWRKNTSPIDPSFHRLKFHCQWKLNWNYFVNLIHHHFLVFTVLHSVKTIFRTFHNAEIFPMWWTKILLRTRVSFLVSAKTAEFTWWKQPLSQPLCNCQQRKNKTCLAQVEEFFENFDTKWWKRTKLIKTKWILAKKHPKYSRKFYFQCTAWLLSSAWLFLSVV